MRLTTAVVAFLAVSAFADQSVPDPVSERVEVNLVNVDVTVLEHSGRPVADLTKNDFDVFEDGVRRVITNFSVVTTDRDTLPAGGVVDMPRAAEPSRRRVVIVFIDERSIGDKLTRNQTIAQAEQMLAGPNDNSMWCVLTLGLMSTLENVVPFTTDRNAFQAGLESVRKGVRPPKHGVDAAVPFDPQDDFACETADCVMQTYPHIRVSDAAFFAALSQTIRRIGSRPGSKAILLVSADVPPYGQGSEIYQSIVRRAGAANVRIYVLDPQGAGSMNASGAFWLSRGTGGLYLPSNRVAESLQRFEQTTRNFYEIGYVTGPDDDKYHHIEVRLKRRGRFSVLHREGYVRLSRR